jgi:hypothetical protein
MWNLRAPRISDVNDARRGGVSRRRLPFGTAMTERKPPGLGWESSIDRQRDKPA